MHPKLVEKGRGIQWWRNTKLLERNILSEWKLFIFSRWPCIFGQSGSERRICSEWTWNTVWRSPQAHNLSSMALWTGIFLTLVQKWMTSIYWKMKCCLYFFRNICSICSAKVFLGSVQTMHTQTKMSENFTVAQITGTKFYLAKWGKFHNVLGTGERNTVLQKENYSIGQTQVKMTWFCLWFSFRQIAITMQTTRSCAWFNKRKKKRQEMWEGNS